MSLHSGTVPALSVTFARFLAHLYDVRQQSTYRAGASLKAGTFLDRPLRWAITHLRRAVELDPLNLKFNDNLGQGLLNGHRDDGSLVQLNKTIDRDPNFAGTYGDLANLYRYQGKYDLWLDALKNNATLNDSQEDLALLAEVQPVYKQSGYQAAVNRMIELYKRRRERSYFDRGLVAEEFAFIGEKEHAFEWLEKAYREKSDEMVSLRIRRCLTSYGPTLVIKTSSDASAIPGNGHFPSNRVSKYSGYDATLLHTWPP